MFLVKADVGADSTLLEYLPIILIRLVGRSRLVVRTKLGRVAHSLRISGNIYYKAFGWFSECVSTLSGAIHMESATTV